MVELFGVEKEDLSKESKHVGGRGNNLDIIRQITATAIADLSFIPLSEVLDADSRPTFILDLDPDVGVASNLKFLSPVFCNSSLRSYEDLRDVIEGEANVSGIGQPDTVPYDDFRAWATSVTPHDATRDVWPTSYQFCGMLWTGCTVRRRFRMISGIKCYKSDSVTSGDLTQGLPPELAIGVPAKQSRPATEHTLSGNGTAAQISSFGRGTRESSLPRTLESSALQQASSLTSLEMADQSSLFIDTEPAQLLSDWTVDDPKGKITEHIRFARSIDWSTTPLRAMSTWSPELRQIANLVMQNPHPIALFYGDELTVMYNEAYRDKVAGTKHPYLMGTGAQGPFSDLWSDVAPLFAECRRTGRSISMTDQLLPMTRNGSGFLEETYFSWCFVPIYGGTDKILGFYNAPFETTGKMLAERRTKTLRNLGEETSLAKTVKEFWPAVLRGFQDNIYDVPFALLYSVADLASDDGDNSTLSSDSNMSFKSCILEGCLGVPRGHDAAPESIDLKRSREGFVPAFREAMRTREPSVLQVRDGSLPESLLEDIEWRGYPEPCREATIFPLRPTNGENVLGFLLIGTNPRLPYNDAYQSFVNILNRQLATALASTILFEDELRRGRTAAEAAALEKEALSEQLATQTRRWEKMSELSSTVGLFILSPDGQVIQANNTWYRILKLSRDNESAMYWMDSFTTKEEVETGWHQLTIDKKPWSGELQTNRSWLDVEGNRQNSWVLAAAHPEYDLNGDFIGIMGSLTDISHLKWVESLQSLRLVEAERQRQQQNNFIDITSHEMRNPLSAILQCADDVSMAMHDLQNSPNSQVGSEIIQDCKDAAETISFCAQHQKSIVDDILTISKLDSDLLRLNPAVVQPLVLAQRACKMFEAEAQNKGIELEFHMHKTFEDLTVDSVTMDASRVMQVLINLLTNAIKFTQSESERSIKVRLSAFLTPPESGIEDFTYVPTKSLSGNISKITDKQDWGTGDLLYIGFVVEDTGRGLTVDEKKMLFQRFSQASPRTHAQYGGSGLGLFISRQLTELHGGRIGVASQYGAGSSFGFYILSRRADPRLAGDPDDTLEPGLRQQDRKSVPIGDGFTSIRRHISNDIRGGEERETEVTSVGQTSPITPQLRNQDIWILIVEDNLVNQKVLRKQLHKLKYNVSVANHGKEALEHIASTSRWSGNPTGQALSLILMDLEMPVMNGETAARTIRQLELDGQLDGHIPIIAVSANVRAEQVTAARNAGMDDVVSKPFRIPELVAKMNEILA